MFTFDFGTLSGKYTPLHQYLYLDALTVVPKDLTAEEVAPRGNCVSSFLLVTSDALIARSVVVCLVDPPLHEPLQARSTTI